MFMYLGAKKGGGLKSNVNRGLAVLSIYETHITMLTPDSV
jgi:hypothetical protein